MNRLEMKKYIEDNFSCWEDTITDKNGLLQKFGVYASHTHSFIKFNKGRLTYFIYERDITYKPKEVLYPIVLHKDDNSCWGATVPDLKGCFGAGDDIDNAVSSTREAMMYHLETLASEGEGIPKPSNIHRLMESSEYEGGSWVIITLDVSGTTGLNS